MAARFGVGKIFFGSLYARGILTTDLGEQLELGLLVAFVGDETFKICTAIETLS